jgi:hypothetical protein
MVIDVLPQFELILGTDWSRKHQITADLGDESDNPLCLRHPHVTLYPGKISILTAMTRNKMGCCY